MSHLSGSSFVLDSQFSYSPYGATTQVAGTGATPDFGYAGYYVHQRSGLNLTATRAYSSNFGRFFNRDALEEQGGINLFVYGGNDPVEHKDPNGTLLAAVLPLLPAIIDVAIDTAILVGAGGAVGAAGAAGVAAMTGGKGKNKGKSEDAGWLGGRTSTQWNRYCNKKYEKCLHCVSPQPTRTYAARMRKCMGECGYPPRWAVDKNGNIPGID